jgi:homopolymeric O-antigen transport system ATP-binding protein
MSELAVRAEGLSKQYRLGAAVQGRLTDAVADGFGRLRRLQVGSRERDVIWALKDVSFEVAEGEVVGFMGRNGAGKSTLLKVLSRITKPTTGYADVRGRVGSLLEVGSGFHPELTGRENVYLYGAVLGMRSGEVRRKFDDIVSFAEVERFLDTPVKRYSSGMYMRLAFAVAAHLEPEILIVDEVLAVGDIAFQQKCLGKMQETASVGRTVLFVSHNTAAVRALCQRAYLLDAGRIVASGPAAAIVDDYVSAVQRRQASPVHERTDRGGDGSIRITSVDVADASARAITSSSRLRVTLAYESESALRHPRFAVTIHDAEDEVIAFYRLDTDAEPGLPDVLPARGRLVCVTGPINLTAGDCGVKVAAWRGGTLADHVERAGSFTIHADDFYPSGRPPGRARGAGLIRHNWELSNTGAGAE